VASTTNAKLAASATGSGQVGEKKTGSRQRWQPVVKLYDLKEWAKEKRRYVPPKPRLSLADLIKKAEEYLKDHPEEFEVRPCPPSP
jgi:hypothetical protein